MVNIINPEVEVVDYGPKIIDKKGKVIMTPDQLIYGAAGITFKNTGFLEQALSQIQNENITDEQITDSLIKSVGGGHASLATTPAIWFAIKGNASKMVDSMFTGAVYESALMPSGRRIPIAKDQIVVPAGIVEKGEEAINLYMRTSETNIDAYEKLMEGGVPKEEAAKIVQYGHRGGGFLFMPLETIVSFARDFKENPKAVPREGHEVMAQIEDFIRNKGMEKTYFGRLNAPRKSCPNPGIFHNGNTLTKIIESDFNGVQNSPIILDESYSLSQEGIEKIEDYLREREIIFSSPERVEKSWKNLLAQLNAIIKENNNSFSITTIANIPWRVWGEVKRHRTLRQSAESVYNAAERALEVVRRTKGYLRKGKTENLEQLTEEYNAIFSMPPAIKKDPNKLKYWLNKIVDSFESYDKLIEMGVSESDAIHVIPRGIKLGVEKKFDLYNLTLGYLSLRLCDTCEPEMKMTSIQERDLMMGNQMPESVKQLLTPKCSYVGFCPEGSYNKKCCKKIHSYVPEYNREIHEQIQERRREGILYEIKRGVNGKSWTRDHSHFMTD